MIYIEDISEDYGTHGVSVYSLVAGMEYYYAEVRASGITILTDLENGAEMGDNEPIKRELIGAVFDKTIEWTKEI